MMNDFQKEIWKNNYIGPGETKIEDTFDRVAKTVSSIQPDKQVRQLIYNNIYKMLMQWKFVSGGRITSNIGVKERPKATLYNCYVYHPYDFGIRDIDSMQVIFQSLKKSAKILASQGGLGINPTYIRPNGTFIKGTGVRTPGVLKFLEMWNKASQIVTAGSNKKIDDKYSKNQKKKIRKGAQLCFSQDTEILTTEGYRPILQIIKDVENNKPVKCQFQNGESFDVVNPIINEPSPIYLVQTQDGSKIQCTADHKFVVYNVETKQQYLKALCDIDEQKQLFKIVKK